jgi:hypothetical protein
MEEGGVRKEGVVGGREGGGRGEGGRRGGREGRKEKPTCIASNHMLWLVEIVSCEDTGSGLDYTTQSQALGL